MQITVATITKPIKSILTKGKNFLMQTVFNKQFTVSALAAALIADIVMKGQYGIIAYVTGVIKSLTEKGAVNLEAILVVAVLVLIAKK